MNDNNEFLTIIQLFEDRISYSKLEDAKKLYSIHNEPILAMESFCDWVLEEVKEVTAEEITKLIALDKNNHLCLGDNYFQILKEKEKIE